MPIVVAQQAGFLGRFKTMCQYSQYAQLAETQRASLDRSHSLQGAARQLLQQLVGKVEFSMIKSGQEFSLPYAWNKSDKKWLDLVKPLLEAEGGLSFLIFGMAKKYQVAAGNKTGFWARKKTVYLSINALTFFGQVDALVGNGLTKPEEKLFADWFGRMEEAMKQLPATVKCGC
jgi:hypothetical protein